MSQHGQHLSHDLCATLYLDSAGAYLDSLIQDLQHYIGSIHLGSGNLIPCLLVAVLVKGMCSS